MDDAVSKAVVAAKTGDAVLLSPACSSLDMFDDYRARAALCAGGAGGGRMSVVVDEKRYDTALLLACAVLLFIGLTTLFSLGLAKSGNWFYKQFFYALLAIILFIAPVVCRLVNGSKPPPIWPSARLRCCFPLCCLAIRIRAPVAGLKWD